MKDKKLEKIIKFFNEIGCPIKIGLKKITKNNSFNKAFVEYAVIYEGGDIMFNKEKRYIKSDFERQHGLEIKSFCGDYFRNRTKLLKILNERDYGIIYSDDK
ncbi:MAG: hypothetical protein AABX80_00955 [Nanoarchaeota archaeon]